MSQQATSTPQYSADGKFYWDGAQWTPVSQPPQLSPDGRFYWDGQKWAPMQAAPVPSATGHQDRPMRAGGITVLVGAGVVILGTLFPWVTATGPFGNTLSKNGIEADGIFVAIGALVMAALGAIGLARRHPSVVLGVLLLLGSLGLGTLAAVVTAEFVSGISSLNSSAAISASMGMGVFVSGIGILIVLVGSIVALAARQD